MATLRIGSAALLLMLGACNRAPAGNQQGDGQRPALTAAQFAEVRSNCGLDGATLRDSDSSQTTTNPDGSTSTVTTRYVDGPSGGKTIVLPASMDQGAVAKAIVCLNGEFDRLGAEARLQPPEGIGL